VATDRVALALLASPLLGPAVWASTADRLRQRGWDVLLPSAYDDLAGPQDVVDHLLAEIPGDRPVALVPHSNAGLYVAALAAARRVTAVVFADAGLPAGAPTTPAAPPQFREFLATLADRDGLLPPWTQWWSPDDLEGEFPDDELRAVVEQEQVRLPLAYFEAGIPSPPGWEALPAAYLAFGDTYAAERAAAERRGWPVRTLAGGHLLPLAEPEAVAAAIEALLGQMGLVPPR
jgi:hypothetical protein